MHLLGFRHQSSQYARLVATAILARVFEAPKQLVEMDLIFGKEARKDNAPRDAIIFFKGNGHF